MIHEAAGKNVTRVVHCSFLKGKVAAPGNGAWPPGVGMALQGCCRRIGVAPRGLADSQVLDIRGWAYTVFCLICQHFKIGSVHEKPPSGSPWPSSLKAASD